MTQINMETIYIPGDSAAFKVYVDEHKAELKNIDGHSRWVVTNEDGTKVIVRPEEARP